LEGFHDRRWCSWQALLRTSTGGEGEEKEAGATNCGLEILKFAQIA
jgi:hypothetical protein